ncbi:MAG TPA: LptA/OstA family protein [Armatimonadota bacterium]
MARTAGALAGISAVAGLAYLPVWLHRHDPPPPSLTRRPADVTLADVPDATLIGRDRGLKVWQIHAQHVLAAVDGHTTTFVGVDRGTLFRKGQAAARVSAGRAVYDDYSRVLKVSEGLRLSAGRLTVRTSRLSWSAVSGALMCPSAVAVRWPRGAASVSSLKADTHLKIVTGRNVSVAAQLEEDVSPRIAKGAGAIAALALFLSAPANTAPVTYKEVRLHGDRWRFDQTTKTHVYDGHITAMQGDTTVRADHAAYNETANTAAVSGHITVDTPTAHAEGDTADVDFNAKLIRLRGANGVRIVAKPKPPAPGQDPKGLRASIKEPVTLDCKGVDYYYKQKRAEAEGPLTVTRTGQTLTGDKATYLSAEDLITVTGNVHGKDDKGQTFEAPTVKVYVKEGAEWMEAPNVSATFHIKDEEEEAKPAKP